MPEPHPAALNRAAEAARPLRVALVDDTTVVRQGLPLLLPGVTFVAIHPDSETLLRERPDVDVLLLDLNLSGPGRSGVQQGVEAVRACTAGNYRVCVYTVERRRYLLLRCLQAGARGIVHKTDSTGVLHRVLRDVAAGEIVITPALAGLAELAEHREQLPALSRRQREVLAARARGEPFRSIARRLDITERTAQEHWSVVTEKFARYLRAHSAADLEHLLGLDPGTLRSGNEDIELW